MHRLLYLHSDERIELIIQLAFPLIQRQNTLSCFGQPFEAQQCIMFIRDDHTRKSSHAGIFMPLLQNDVVRTAAGTLITDQRLRRTRNHQAPSNPGRSRYLHPRTLSLAQGPHLLVGGGFNLRQRWHTFESVS